MGGIGDVGRYFLLVDLKLGGSEYIFFCAGYFFFYCFCSLLDFWEKSLLLLVYDLVESCEMGVIFLGNGG